MNVCKYMYAMAINRASMLRNGCNDGFDDGNGGDDDDDGDGMQCARFVRGQRSR